MKKETTMEKKADVRNGTKRLIFAGIALIIEIAFLAISLHSWLGKYAGTFSVVYHLLAVIIVLALCSQERSSSIKMPWIILIMAAPLLGVSLYLFIGLNGSTRHMRKRYEEADRRLFPFLKQDPEAAEDLREWNRGVYNISSYLREYAGYPVFRNTDVVFYDDAADGLAAQKEDLKKARKFIFMEYHAIEDAESWHGIQEILEEKVKEGVDVRVFYDDMGSIGFITTDFVKKLESVGIACRDFNPVSPFVNLFLNNRDHRKITVIDGRVGFTGGYNMANEYFNVTHPYGHWKDTGIRLEGQAVRALTLAFLEMWNAVKDEDADDTAFAKFFPEVEYSSSENGFVQPYADSPMDDIHVGEDVYASIAESAKDYLYIMTPYLIITDEMTHTRALAAKRGVDVRIITPGIPDKKLIYKITRSFYGNLVKNGVRIYEYTPGFCHAKMCVSDDVVATCGTINFDYRSLYHHFENGCMMARVKVVTDIKEDFERTFPVCREVTQLYRDDISQGRSLVQLVLRLVAPLL